MASLAELIEEEKALEKDLVNYPYHPVIASTELDIKRERLEVIKEEIEVWGTDPNKLHRIV